MTMTTKAPRPAAYAEGYGELVRAYRLYIGVSQRTMAARIGIAEKSLSDIELGRRQCPPGFIDTVEKVVEEFTREVKEIIDEVSETVRNSADALDNSYTPVPTSAKVTDNPRDEWRRAVVGRAAVESGLIMPILVGNVRPRERARR